MSAENLMDQRKEIRREIYNLLGIEGEYTNEKKADPNNDPVQLYAKIYNIGFANDRFYISGDLLTEKLIKFDREYFNSNNVYLFEKNKSSLRPVFSAFMEFYNRLQIIK